MRVSASDERTFQNAVRNTVLRPSRSYPRWAEVASAVMEQVPSANTNNHSNNSTSPRSGSSYRVIPASPRPRRSYQRSNSVQHQPQAQQQEQQHQQLQVHQVQLHNTGAHKYNRGLDQQQQRQQQFRSSVSNNNNKFGICLACLFKKFVLR